MKIRKKNIIPYKGKVYDLSVKNTHTYNVEGVAVHNSAAGCLVSYLIGITKIDPIPHGLIFSRFLNKGRFKPGEIEYPDIDVDFPAYFKDTVLDYVRDKYGKDNVAQIATYGTMKAASALQEVLRMHEAMSYSEITKVSKLIPAQDKVSDKMKEVKETNLLRYVLKHTSLLEDYCKYDENDQLSGDLAPYFEQAIRLEGTIKQHGIHAAGVIISPKVLKDYIPLIKSKSGELVCGYDMDSMKDVGGVKFDFLVLSTLDCLMDVNKMLLEEVNVTNSKQKESSIS